MSRFRFFALAAAGLVAGSRLEAMGNRAPFENFLLLVGKVPGDWGTRP